MKRITRQILLTPGTAQQICGVMEKENMNIESQVAIAIFDQFFQIYCDEQLDDEYEFIPVVKSIVDGASLLSENPKETRKIILKHIKDKYIEECDCSPDEARDCINSLLEDAKIKP